MSATGLTSLCKPRISLILVAGERHISGIGNYRVGLSWLQMLLLSTKYSVRREWMLTYLRQLISQRTELKLARPDYSRGVQFAVACSCISNRQITWAIAAATRMNTSRGSRENNSDTRDIRTGAYRSNIANLDYWGRKS